MTPIHDLAWQDIAWYLFAIATGTLGVARCLRLLTNDDFPPIVWFRNTWGRLTNDGEWSNLVHCLWCAAPYLVAADIAWAVLSDLHWSWWLFNGWMAVSYAASWLVFHDEDGVREEE